MIYGLMIAFWGALIEMFAAQPADHRPKPFFVNPDIQLVQLTDSVYVHETWHHLVEFARFASHGMPILMSILWSRGMVHWGILIFCTILSVCQGCIKSMS
ncbi:MAG: hypothetical protein U5R06_11030 [candidate division KSB1 bacterium]|nr:hypothetical protein [candidate division KSB1 bacterium]